MAFPVGLGPSALLLALAVALDLTLGDPDYRWHPVRMIGRAIAVCERGLRYVGFDGYGGGVLLLIIVGGIWTAGVSVVVTAAARWNPWIGAAGHVFLLYSLLALGDLLRHGRRIESALRRGDLRSARAATAQLVGRDTDSMDAPAARRAAVESLSENLTDAVVSPLFWYVVGGLPGVVLFKVVSTMDSMVGYKTPRYLRIGWCGARLDDVMNYVPARATWLLLALVSVGIPGCSARKALGVGFRQHGALPSPNSGWSEAAIAGALQRRLVGPIWANGTLVTDRWIGVPSDPPLEQGEDYDRAAMLVTVSGLTASALACALVL